MKLTKAQRIHLLIAALIFALIELLLPAAYGLTPAGKHFLAVFFALVYMWITIETFIPSVIALAAFGILQVTKSSAIFSGSFGHPTVAIFLFACIMITAARDCGVMKKIALWFISRRVTAGHPYVFLFFLALANFVLGGLLTNVYSLMITVPIVLSVCERLDYKKGERFYTAVFLLSMWGSLGGGIALPFAKSIYLSMNAAASGYGIDISYLQVMAMGVPVGFVWTMFGLPVIRFVIRPDHTKFMSYDPREVEREMREEPLDARGKLVTWGFFVMTGLWCLTIFNGIFAFATYLNKIGFHIIGCAVVSILCVIQVKDGPVVDLRRIMPTLSWPVLGFLAMIMFTSSAFNSPDYGIKDFLISLLSPVFADVSPAVLVITGVVAAGLMTNLMSNVVTCVVIISVFLPLLLSVSDLGGISAPAFCLAATVVAGMSCATPSAFPGGSLVYGEHVSMADSIRPCVTMVLLGSALCIAAAFVY